MNPANLSRATRREAIRAMREDGPLDVLVIGGGVVGAGSALDAVTRGLRTGLVEAQDWASGTSSRSSKLIHGGLRYLEMMDFGLVREALRERGLLANRIAPHLVHPIPFLYPLTHRGWERLYVGSGIALYDVMAQGARSVPGLPHHRHLSRRGALAIAPSLRADVLTGAIQYYDAQVDDARHTMTLVRTAASHGALVASRVRVVGLEKTGARVEGARVRDLETGEEMVVRASQVISATGVWTDNMQALAGVEGQAHVRASKGVHLLVARERLNLGTGLILRTEKSVLFVIPWGAHWIIGTTDTDYQGDLTHPVATDEDIDYLLEHVNAAFVTPLRRDEIEGVYAGLRPLLTGNSESTAKLSREHLVDVPAPGLVAVAGGKYTTYRVMAQDAVDVAVKNLSRLVPPSTTATVRLLGAQRWTETWNARDSLATRSGLDLAVIERLLGRYGDQIGDLLELIEADPSLAQSVGGDSDYVRVEVVFAVTHEGAFHLDDVLMRRTHASIESKDHALSVAPSVADLMAPLLDWDLDQVANELENYREVVASETEWMKGHVPEGEK